MNARSGWAAGVVVLLVPADVPAEQPPSRRHESGGDVRFRRDGLPSLCDDWARHVSRASAPSRRQRKSSPPPMGEGSSIGFARGRADPVAAVPAPLDAGSALPGVCDAASMINGLLNTLPRGRGKRDGGCEEDVGVLMSRLGGQGPIGGRVWFWCWLRPRANKQSGPIDSPQRTVAAAACRTLSCVEGTPLLPASFLSSPPTREGRAAAAPK